MRTDHSRLVCRRVTAMARVDSHSLVNFPTARKLLASLSLLLGAALFFAALVVEVLITGWEPSFALVLRWGDTLSIVEDHSAAVFWALFAGHAASLILIVAVANPLFSRVAMASGARKALL